MACASDAEAGRGIQMRQDGWQKETAAIIMKGLAEIAAIAGFIFLAFKFGHWWIALFSILFCFSDSEKEDRE